MELIKGSTKTNGSLPTGRPQHVGQKSTFTNGLSLAKKNIYYLSAEPRSAANDYTVYDPFDDVLDPRFTTSSNNTNDSVNDAQCADINTYCATNTKSLTEYEITTNGKQYQQTFPVLAEYTSRELGPHANFQEAYVALLDQFDIEVTLDESNSICDSQVNLGVAVCKYGESKFQELAVQMLHLLNEISSLRSEIADGKPRTTGSYQDVIYKLKCEVGSEESAQRSFLTMMNDKIERLLNKHKQLLNQVNSMSFFGEIAEDPTITKAGQQLAVALGCELQQQEKFLERRRSYNEEMIKQQQADHAPILKNFFSGSDANSFSDMFARKFDLENKDKLSNTEKQFLKAWDVKDANDDSKLRQVVENAINDRLANKFNNTIVLTPDTLKELAFQTCIEFYGSKKNAFAQAYPYLAKHGESEFSQKSYLSFDSASHKLFGSLTNQNSAFKNVAWGALDLLHNVKHLRTQIELEQPTLKNNQTTFNEITNTLNEISKFFDQVKSRNLTNDADISDAGKSLVHSLMDELKHQALLLTIQKSIVTQAEKSLSKPLKDVQTQTNLINDLKEVYALNLNDFDAARNCLTTNNAEQINPLRLLRFAKLHNMFSKVGTDQFDERALTTFKEAYYLQYDEKALAKNKNILAAIENAKSVRLFQSVTVDVLRNKNYFPKLSPEQTRHLMQIEFAKLQRENQRENMSGGWMPDKGKVQLATVMERYNTFRPNDPINPENLQNSPIFKDEKYGAKLNELSDKCRYGDKAGTFFKRFTYYFSDRDKAMCFGVMHTLIQVALSNSPFIGEEEEDLKRAVVNNVTIMSDAALEQVTYETHRSEIVPFLNLVHNDHGQTLNVRFSGICRNAM